MTRTPAVVSGEGAQPVTVEVEIENDAWRAALPDAERLVEHAARAALGRRQAESLVVLLADDPALEDLNRRFRGKASPTNVLAFPAPATIPGYLGDVAVALGVCQAEARAQSKPLADHVQHLVVHGVLHLLGYDHVDDGQAEAMESLEREVLRALGVPDPYAAERLSTLAQDDAPHV